MKRLVVSRLLIGVLLVVSTVPFFGCDRDKLKGAANDIVFSLQTAQPLIENLLPSAKPEIGQGIDIAVKLKDAILKSDSANAIGFLGDLVPAFQAIVRDDIPQIKDPAVRTEIMAALALANISLHFLVDNLTKSAPNAMMAARPGAKTRAVREFASEPVWGEQYKIKKR